MSFSAGMTVRCRGLRCVVLDAHPVDGGAPPAYRLRVRATEGPFTLALEFSCCIFP